MDRDDFAFLEEIFAAPISAISQRVLIVNQSESRKLISDRNNIRVLNMSSYGLCRSRNLALQNTSTKLAWILDDDVRILPDACLSIIDAFNKYLDSTAITFKADLPEGGQMRNYEKQDFIYQTRDVQRGPVSFEIVLNTERMRQNGVIFNERFGLGAQFPLCEEQVFFNDLLRAGQKAIFVSKTIVIHPAESSGIDPTKITNLYARGALARYRGKNIVWFKFKNLVFLFRKGYMLNPLKLWQAAKTMQEGANDYLKKE